MVVVNLKRLIKKSEDINTHDHIDVTPHAEDTESMEGMVKLDEFSEADVRHERCPTCRYNPLKREDGFKICPKCDNIYKVLDGNGYIVIK